MADIYNPYNEGFRKQSGNGAAAWIDGGGAFVRRVRKYAEAEEQAAQGPPGKRRRNPHSQPQPQVYVNGATNPSGGCGGRLQHQRYNQYHYHHHHQQQAIGFNNLALMPRNERLCVPSLKEDKAVAASSSASSAAAWPLSRSGNAAEAESSSADGSHVYYTREAIERHSPSRKDGIDWHKENILRFSYAQFLQSLGIRLQLPQIIIATAIVLCHRFFLRRSHAAHDRFLIATACMFLVAKSEEHPRPLNTVLLVSYEICHSSDFSRFHCMLPTDWFDQYKQRVLDAEKMILTTLNFELTVHHPYGPLMTVLNKLGLAQTALVHVAWNLITSGLKSSLCLQFKPHHIAAGAVYLAAQILNVDMSSLQNIWQEFQAPSDIIKDVVNQLAEIA